jgi:hypothetical protein
MNPGDPIWYRQRWVGGYEFAFDVPGEFVKATEHRIVVRLLLKSGKSVEIAVATKNVRPRDPEAVLHGQR